MIFSHNFTVFDQQVKTVTTGGVSGQFSANGQKATQVMLVNTGSAGCQVIFSATSPPTAVNSASASGTRQIYVPAGAVITTEVGNCNYFNAITDSGSTQLILHAGEGT